MNLITMQKIQAFKESLYLNEKSKATVSKYLQAVRKLAEYLRGEELTKPRLLEYREILQSRVKADCKSPFLPQQKSLHIKKQMQAFLSCANIILCRIFP